MGVVEDSAFCPALEDNETQAAVHEARKRAMGIGVCAFEQELVFAREEGVSVRQYFPPLVKRLLGDRVVRVDRDEGSCVGRKCCQQGALHVERHRREMKRPSGAPFRGDECWLRRHLFVRRAPQPVNQTPNMPFVKQPGAHAGTTQGMHAAHIDAALLKFVEYLSRIVVATDADESRARVPQRCAKSAVQQRATWLPHARRAVGKNDVVDEQVAQQHDGIDHGGGGGGRRLDSSIGLMIPTAFPSGSSTIALRSPQSASSIKAELPGSSGSACHGRRC